MSATWTYESRMLVCAEGSSETGAEREGRGAPAHPHSVPVSGSDLRPSCIPAEIPVDSPES